MLGRGWVSLLELSRYSKAGSRGVRSYSLQGVRREAS